MITPISIIDSLTKQVKEQIINEEDKERYLEIIQKVIREEYLTILENEIAKAFISAYEEQAQSLFDSYLDNAEAYTNRTIMKDQITREERDPDEKFMQTIEEQIGIVGSASEGFRGDVTAYMFAKMRRGEKIKDIARIVTRSKSRDDDQKKKYSEMVKTLIDEYEYTESSAEEVLTFAANNLWRDS
jgi:serine protein kinase